MSETDPFDQPMRHLRRTAPPWAAEAKTICGRDLSDVGAWMEFEEAKTLVSKVGQRRAQFLFCQVCLDRHTVKVATPDRWDREPAKITRDWAEKAAWRRSVDAEQVAVELLALADLVAEHRAEFDAYVQARLSDDLAARRKTRKAAR